jgi:dephospho-CoA kinase
VAAVIVLGLTGSIGMGKSTAARMLRGLGLPVHDADAVVHGLLAKGGAAVPAVAAAFPGVERDGAIDRRALGSRVFGDDAALARLEAILHPLVRRSQDAFLKRQVRLRRPIAVLDIPLLFETGAERFCDAVIVVSAPALVQKARVLSRPGMTADKWAAIRGQQMPDREKRRRADFVVPTGQRKADALRRLRKIVRLLRATGRPSRRTRRLRPRRDGNRPFGNHPCGNRHA